ncbi:hypothetical protein [Halomonas sp. I5-271120]|uniref:hypothetical protein n=1 Tax=Halomonas sp. I5-271120 TaxID=3061632 RepID=UPI0027147121|nr:hypothetical protein [Halomonas sp. I5-271120]
MASEDNKRTLYIAALPTTHVDNRHPEDVDVPGIYSVNEIDADLSDEDAANVALASFHAHQGMKVLDDYEFEVIDGKAGTFLTPSFAEDVSEHDCIKICEFDDLPEELRSQLFPNGIPAGALQA